MKCKRCGTEVPIGAIMCPGCGAQVEAGTVRCPGCGVTFKAGLSLCPHRGSELEYGQRLSFPLLPVLSRIALIALAFLLYSLWPFPHVELPEFSAVIPPTPMPTATPTFTPTPTNTPIPTPTYTATPTFTPTVTPTSTPQPGAVVTFETLNLQAGPGTVYDRIGLLHKGDELDVTARTSAGDWLKVFAPEGTEGWVFANAVELNIPLGAIPVSTEIPSTPVPPALIPTAVPTVIPTPRLIATRTAVLWNVPSYRQKHSLSCEAASLRMIFLYFGVDVAEDQLIQEIGFDPTPLQKQEDGEIIWGDPNEGYVGNIDGEQLSYIAALDESFKEHPLEIWGYGVHQDPLIRVAKRHGFLTAKISNIGQIYRYLRRGWLIIVFVPHGGGTQAVVWEWRTTDGESVKVMNGEHAIVVKGYDNSYIHVEDPLGKVTRYSRPDFELAWSNLRMGVALKYPPASEPPSAAPGPDWQGTR